ncbi:IS200/IS605 family transposase [Micromonospora olivasterospora]|uniref:IS200/IS605 family transposase n=1 Tax=Micromonospora olivasterospora TaxID=1880 RepID=UPI001B8617DE
MAEYQTSRGAAYSLGYHVVWCPKYRRPVLVGPVAERLRDLIGQKCDEHGWSIVALEVMPDHVHLFVRADPNASPSYIANQFKAGSSRARSAGTSCSAPKWRWGHQRSTRSLARCCWWRWCSAEVGGWLPDGAGGTRAVGVRLSAHEPEAAASLIASDLCSEWQLRWALEAWRPSGQCRSALRGAVPP